jgi:N-acetyl-anhydromuramyl-L-alanine amidase AmpD
VPFSLPPPIEQLPATHWTERAGSPIVAIVAHATGGTDSRSTLQFGDGRGVSIHKLIARNGTINDMLPDVRGANHAGAQTARLTISGRVYRAGQINQATLGFELENRQNGAEPYTDSQLLALGWQIDQWRAVHGPLPIVRHQEIDPTRRSDPQKLSVQAIEQWVYKARAAAFQSRVFRVKGVPVFQRQELTGPIAGFIHAPDTVEVDQTYPNGAGHLKTGLGFVDMDALESI